MAVLTNYAFNRHWRQYRPDDHPDSELDFGVIGTLAACGVLRMINAPPETKSFDTPPRNKAFKRAPRVKASANKED